MQFSYHWLKTWIDPQLSPADFAHLLTMSGLEVEESQKAAPDFSGVIVAEVLELEAHPNADRLRVAKVNTGKDIIQIVCGAPNVAVGKKVPCAVSGALLPGDFAIKPTVMRGVESNGMLCSAKELGLPEDVNGLLILPQDAPIGMAVRDYLDLDDTLFVLKITPNRADCLSIKGIARETAALLQKEYHAPVIEKMSETSAETRPIAIEAKAACGRYLGRVVTGVNMNTLTPLWMRQRLERSGLRCINPVVDITNYVMLELGQPMHAFDQDKLSGGINVRMAQSGETLLCLNGKEVILNQNTLVIADEQKALAMAGFMGGEESAVTENTQNVFLEAAYFAPEMVSGKSRQYGFGSDSAFRYERGVDFTLQKEAMERATALLIEIAGGQAGGIVEALGDLPLRADVTIRPERANKVLGVQLEQIQMEDILNRLGLVPKRVNDCLRVQVPSFRFDIVIEEDLIEEIGRVFGYDNIPSEAPIASLKMLPIFETQAPRARTYQHMAARDYQEQVSYAFVDEAWEQDFAANINPIRLKNPIASQMSVMRSTLLGGLVQTLNANLNRKHSRVRLFEVARIFYKDEQGAFIQTEKLGGLAFGSVVAEQWAQVDRKVDFYDVKADVESLFAHESLVFQAAKHPALHPGRSAQIVLDEKVIGFIGQLHPVWVQKYDLPNAPIVFEVDFQATLQQDKVTYHSVSKFQPVRRDLAFVLPETVTAGRLGQSLRAVDSDIVQAISLFDQYLGQGIAQGMKSLAFSIHLQAPDRTLSDEEVDALMAQMIEAAKTTGASLRA